MFINKKIITAIILILCVLSLCFLSLGQEAKVIPSFSKSSKQRIIIDAGHGGFDGGAVAQDGTIEKDINLNISVALRDILIQNGYEVIMTRETDISTASNEKDRTTSQKKSDLMNRLELMKANPDALFVSIHLNKFTTSAASGSQVFYSGNLPESKLLGDFIQSSIINLLQPQNKRVNKKATSSTYLLYNAPIPAVLVECGFLSNSKDLQNLKNSEYQNQMAFSIFCGINEYFLKFKEL